jgi:mRNA-degrading endonuclease YafQ of YafQ-DinJ toxin-antitoxin module
MTTKFKEVVFLREFERDLKTLIRQYPTLKTDIETLIDKALFAYHKLNIDFGGIFPIDDLGETRIPIFKVKKFACRALKGKGVRTGLRLIYAFDKDRDRIELVEIYIKSQKEVEDRKRIKKRYGGQSIE